MCTVSIIRSDEMIRIACNRDEQRTRLPAFPPALHHLGGTRAILPTDTDAGGTWIGVNEFGLAVVLLNMNCRDANSPAPTISRGMIIPSLIHSATTQAATELLNTQTLSCYNPFRLILVDEDQSIECRFDGRMLTMHKYGRLKKLMFTSSGLGDDIVDTPRRQLFDQMLVHPSAAAQDAFHRHSWEEQSHLSVCMRRADAMTVSCTIIEISSAVASMHYHAGPPDVAAESSVVSLPIRQSSLA